MSEQLGPEVITQVPVFGRKELGGSALDATTEPRELITSVPGSEGVKYPDADQKVAEIRNALANRGQKSLPPVVAAGDTIRHP